MLKNISLFLKSYAIRFYNIPFYDYMKNSYFIKYLITFRNIMIDNVKT